MDSQIRGAAFAQHGVGTWHEDSVPGWAAFIYGDGVKKNKE